jgi:hypothetical protein
MSAFVSVLTVLAVTLFAQNPEPATPASALPRMVDIPLVDCSGLPCIDMSTGNGKTLRLLLSTAEANSYLDTKAAQALGLALKPLKSGDGSIITDVQETVVPHAKLGELPIADFPFMVLDTTQPPGNPGAQLEPLPGDGALTYTAFRSRLLQIDYPHQVVRISQSQETAQPCPQPCSDLEERRIGKYGPRTLTTKGFAIYGQPVDAQVDTLFTGTMLVYPHSVQKLGLKKQAKATRKELFPYVENGIKLARYDGAAESFRDVSLVQDGPLYFFTPKDTPPAVDFDVTVGSGIFSHAVVTFDFKGMHMWVERVEPP